VRGKAFYFALLRNMRRGKELEQICKSRNTSKARLGRYVAWRISSGNCNPYQSDI